MTPNEAKYTYYIDRKGEITRRFDLGAGLLRRFLARRFGDTTARRWMVQARQGLDDLIPEIPYIGGKANAFTKFLLYPSIMLPLARAMRDDEVPTREVGQVIYTVSAAAYNAIPAPVRWIMGRGYFRQARIARWREAAARSQRRLYPGDWVCHFVEGDGQDYRYGLDMTECGLLKFWRAQGLEELVPYLCLTDWALWKAIGIEVTRTQTLANGGTCCDYRYVRLGNRGPVGWPPESLPEWSGRYEAGH